MEERKNGVTNQITSAQLCIIKEALEQMKSKYLQMFVDRDLVLKFVEDGERDIEELCYYLSLARSLSLTDAETHEGMGGTHDLREEPLMMIMHEGHSRLQVFEERSDIWSERCFDRAPILYCRDHESFLLAQRLATKEVVKKIHWGPTRK
jgi:hypothetical protein